MRKEDYKELNEIKYKVIDEKHNVLDNSDLVINNNQENLSDEEMLKTVDKIMKMNLNEDFRDGFLNFEEAAKENDNNKMALWADNLYYDIKRQYNLSDEEKNTIKNLFIDVTR